MLPGAGYFTCRCHVLQGVMDAMIIFQMTQERDAVVVDGVTYVFWTRKTSTFRCASSQVFIIITCVIRYGACLDWVLYSKPTKAINCISLDRCAGDMDSTRRKE